MMGPERYYKVYYKCQVIYCDTLENNVAIFSRNIETLQIPNAGIPTHAITLEVFYCYVTMLNAKLNSKHLSLYLRIYVGFVASLEM